MTTSFIALYRGESVGSAEVVAVSAAPELVHDFAERMLADRARETDTVQRELESGRRRALERVKGEASE